MILNIPPTLSQIRAGTLGVDLQMGAKAILLGATASASSGNSLAGMSAQLWINATTKQVFAIGGSGKMSLTSTGLFIDGSGEYLRLGASGIAANTNSDNGIAGRSTGMEYASTTGTPHKWFVAATEYMRLTQTLLEAGKISLGGTIGSSTDPGAGGLYLTGSSNIRGGQKVAVSTKTTTYTATSSDYIILGNHASTPFTINLPAATGSGQVFIIKNINTAAVTVDANASETIDGSLTQVLATNNSITIVDYATGLWAII